MIKDELVPRYNQVCARPNLKLAAALAFDEIITNPPGAVEAMNRTYLEAHWQEVEKILTAKTYHINQASYRIFQIYEPKQRTIMALPIVDRIVQHALALVTVPVIDRNLIRANLANRLDKGVHDGTALTRQYLAQMFQRQHGHADYFVLKADIAGYFYNIDRRLLKQKLRCLFSDPDILWLYDVIIDSSPDLIDPETNQTKVGKGLPIGNLTSQFLAIYYLSDLDHFIKEKLRIKCYLRYMDDFILFHQDKTYLEFCRQQIEDFLLNRAGGLQLNKKTQIFHIGQGVDFLGWHFYQTQTGKIVMLMRKVSKQKRRRANKQHCRRLLLLDKSSRREFEKLAADGMTLKRWQKRALLDWRQSLGSWYGHAMHGDTFRLRVRLANQIRRQLDGNLEAAKVETLAKMIFRSGHKKRKRRRFWGVCKLSFLRWQKLNQRA